MWKSIRQRLLSSRNLQEAADVETALMLTTWWKRIVLGKDEDRTALQQDITAVQRLGGYKQIRQLAKNLDEQVLRMFNAIHTARIPSASSKSSASITSESWNPRKASSSSSSSASKKRDRGSIGADQKIVGFDTWRNKEYVMKALRKELGFTLRVSSSTIPTAGNGVFLDGQARIGSLIGFFPGLVYLSEHLKKEEDVSSLFPDPDFFMTQRYDKVVIDSRDGDKQHHNEYALAHMCNHGKQPNVMTVAYDFPQDPLGWGGFPQELRVYIPNSYTKPRTLLGSPDHSALIQTVVLISLTDIGDNDELLLNYRLNPKLQLPPWYEPVDHEEDERRWG